MLVGEKISVETAVALLAAACLRLGDESSKQLGISIKPRVKICASNISIRTQITNMTPTRIVLFTFEKHTRITDAQVNAVIRVMPSYFEKLVDGETFRNFEEVMARCQPVTTS